MMEKKFKILLIHLNESQKVYLENFFEDIGFYYYAIQTHMERVISQSARHKNSKIWPGTDCSFYLAVEEDYMEEMLSYLKTFRMSLAEGVTMSVTVIPVEQVYPSLYNADIPVKENLLEKLKNKYNYR